jgi:hypothetical protein
MTDEENDDREKPDPTYPVVNASIQARLDRL